MTAAVRSPYGWVGPIWQKKVPHAATTPIVTAFKICISHRKKWALESPAGES
jgi:hypothetical protein